MTRGAKALLAGIMLAGLSGGGVALFSALTAVASPFGGGESATCGPGLTCSSDTFTATEASSGPAFACSAALAECLDPGPGTCNEIGTNVAGDVILGGTDCTPTIRWGDSSSLNGNSWTNTNGAINCEGSCQIRDSGNGTLPINTTGGVVFNSTSAMTGFILLTVTVDIGSITAQTCLDVTATVTGVEANDGVFVTRNFASTANYSVSDAYVTNAGTDEVTFRACNGTGGNIDPASGSYLFWVVRKA